MMPKALRNRNVRFRPPDEGEGRFAQRSMGVRIRFLEPLFLPMLPRELPTEISSLDWRIVSIATIKRGIRGRCASMWHTSLTRPGISGWIQVSKRLRKSRRVQEMRIFYKLRIVLLCLIASGCSVSPKRTDAVRIQPQFELARRDISAVSPSQALQIEPNSGSHSAMNHAAESSLAPVRLAVERRQHTSLTPSGEQQTIASVTRTSLVTERNRETSPIVIFHDTSSEKRSSYPEPRASSCTSAAECD